MSLLESLVSYWPLDEASGTATDAHATNDLAENGTVGSGTGLVYSGARDFEITGGADYLSIADNSSLSPRNTPYTFAAWFNEESSGATRFVFAKHDGGSGREYGLNVNITGNTVNWVVSGDGSTQTALVSSEIISTGTWYLVIVDHDPDSDEISLQVNNGTIQTAAHATGTFDASTAFNIGGRNGAVNWDGLIGPVSYWSRLLTTDERTALYNSGAGLTYEDYAEHYTLAVDNLAVTTTLTAAGLRATRQLPLDSAAYTLALTNANLLTAKRLAVDPLVTNITLTDLEFDLVRLRPRGYQLNYNRPRRAR